MADRTRSFNPRPTPQRQSSVTSQNPPRRTTRSTRSRSHEINGTERTRSGAKDRNTAGRIDATGVDGTTNNGVQSTGKRSKKVRSKPLEDLSIVQEDAGIEYPDLPQNEADLAGQIFQSSKAGQKQNEGKQLLHGDLSAISGSTARPSYSTQDFTDLNQKDIRKKALKRAAVNHNEVAATDENPPSAKTYEPNLDISRTSTGPTGNSSLGNKTIFSSPKAMEGTVSHLHKRGAKRKATDSVRVDEQSAVANSSIHKVPSQHNVNNAEKSSSVSDLIPTELAPQENVDDNWRPVQDDEEAPFTPSEPTLELDAMTRATQVIEHKKLYEAESKKENVAENSDFVETSEAQPMPKQSLRGTKKQNFIDPQPGAIKVAFESQESDLLPQQANERHDKSNPPVEEEYEEMEDPSSDNGYQSDVRTLDVDSRRSKKPIGKRPAEDIVVTHQQSPKKARSSRTRSTTTNNVGDAVARHNQENNPRPSQIANYKKANVQAKLNTAVRPKKVQSRKPWTDEETDSLIRLIEIYGTSWKLLKERDKKEVLIDRDQVALKDKARNIKLDFLKVGTEMPLNFESIALSKIQTEKLRSMGIEYNSFTGRLEDGEMDVDDSTE